MAVTSFSEADIKWLEAHGAKEMHYFSGQKYYEIQVGRISISVQISNGKYWCNVNQFDLYAIPESGSINMRTAIKSAVRFLGKITKRVMDSQKQIETKLDDLFKAKEKHNDH